MFEGLEVTLRYKERGKEELSIRNVVSLELLNSSKFPEDVMVHIAKTMYRQLDDVINYDKDRNYR